LLLYLVGGCAKGNENVIVSNSEVHNREKDDDIVMRCERTAQKK